MESQSPNTLTTLVLSTEQPLPNPTVERTLRDEAAQRRSLPR